MSDWASGDMKVVPSLVTLRANYLKTIKGLYAVLQKPKTVVELHVEEQGVKCWVAIGQILYSFSGFLRGLLFSLIMWTIWERRRYYRRFFTYQTARSTLCTAGDWPINSRVVHRKLKANTAAVAKVTCQST